MCFPSIHVEEHFLVDFFSCFIVVFAVSLFYCIFFHIFLFFHFFCFFQVFLFFFVSTIWTLIPILCSAVSVFFVILCTLFTDEIYPVLSSIYFFLFISFWNNKIIIFIFIVFFIFIFIFFSFFYRVAQFLAIGFFLHYSYRIASRSWPFGCFLVCQLIISIFIIFVDKEIIWRDRKSGDYRRFVIYILYPFLCLLLTIIFGYRYKKYQNESILYLHNGSIDFDEIFSFELVYEIFHELKSCLHAITADSMDAMEYTLYSLSAYVFDD